MIVFNDQELDELSLLEGGLALNAAIDSTTDVHWVRAELAQMTKEAELEIGQETNVELRLQGLLRLFYQGWGFKGDFDQYFSSQNAFIETVLKRRKGIPVTLGSLLLFFAEQFDLPVKAVGFPTQLILRVDWPHRRREYLNPYNGEFVSLHTLHGWLKGKDGPLSELLPEHLELSRYSALIERWLTVIKSAMLREENYAKALRCTEIALSFAPDDPYEIRDRGYIYQQLNCDWVAADDYEYFIAQCPDDPATELLKMQVKVLTEAAPVLH